MTMNAFPDDTWRLGRESITKENHLFSSSLKIRNEDKYNNKRIYFI